MMKKLILGACLACGLVQVECWGMDEFKGEDHLICKKLIVSNGVVKGHQRKLSEPVTQREKSEALHRVSVDEFLKMNESETQQYEDIEFDNIEINENFVMNYVWKLKESVNLIFNHCVCAKGTTYKDLFGSTAVANLQMNSCGLTTTEAAYIICNLYPWTLNSVKFINEANVNEASVIKLVKQRSSLPKNVTLEFN